MTSSKIESTIPGKPARQTPSFNLSRWLAPALFVFTSFLCMSAFAADSTKGNIPFPFMVGSDTVPAGVYQFKIDRTAGLVTIQGPKSSKSALFITTLAAKAHSTATDADLVFDKVGDVYTLSEIWMPGAEGVLLYATKGKHEHNIIHLEPAAMRSESR